MHDSARRVLTRRNLIYGAAVSPLLLRPAKAMDLPPYYAMAVSQTASALLNYQQTGFIPPFSLADHYFAGGNLFAYTAMTGFNQAAAEILQRTMQADSSFLTRIPSLMLEGSSAAAIPINPLLLNYDQSHLPSAEALVQAVGGDLGYLQSDYSNQLVRVFTGPSPVHDRLRARNAQLQRVLLHNLPPRAQISNVTDSGAITSLLAAAGVLVAVGGGLVAAAVAGPALLGASVFAGVTITIMYSAGVGFLVAGGALGVYGIAESIGGGGAHDPAHGPSCCGTPRPNQQPNKN